MGATGHACLEHLGPDVPVCQRQLTAYGLLAQKKTQAKSRKSGGWVGKRGTRVDEFVCAMKQEPASERASERRERGLDTKNDVTTTVWNKRHVRRIKQAT